MSSKVRIEGTFDVHLNQFHRGALTVADVREWLSIIDYYNISDSTILNEAVLSLSLENLFVIPSECGQCSPQFSKVDPLLSLHNCKDQLSFNFDVSSDNI